MGDFNRLRLASYNIRKCIGLDRRRDPGRILQVINGIDADVMVLQEADRRLGPRRAALPHAMVKAETDLAPVELDFTGVSLGFHGNAILLRKGLRATGVHRLDLPGTEPRGAVAIEIEGALRVVAVHLGLLRRDRRRQLAMIVEATRDAMPTAIIGDFNEWRPRVGLEALKPGFRVHSPGRTYHASRPLVPLDRLALCSRLRLRRSGVVEARAAHRASDHLPIWADISIAD